jgi:hypothetical protein
VNSLFNAGFKFVGHECLMQSFDQSVNQLVGRSVVRLCDSMQDLMMGCSIF